MPGAGGTSELYADADNPQSVLGAPPAPPADVPPPTKVQVTQPVTTKARMADERPDGTVRDTSMEALRPGNDLNFRNITDEENKKPEPPPVEAAPPAEPVKEAAPVPEKLYAGKFKTPQDLEKAYEEVEKAKSRAFQEKAQLERQLAATPPAPPAVKSPEQLAADSVEANKLLSEFANDPKKFLEARDAKLMQTTMTALKAQQLTEQWRKDNPDIAEHEMRVAFEANLLMQTDPELAANPVALFSKATEQFRQFTGKIRSEGAKEALVTETRTIPLLNNTAPTPATEQPAKAPLTQDAAFEQHLKMLKAQEQRSHRGLRR